MGDQKTWSTLSYSSSPSTFRFLDNLKQPDPDPNPDPFQLPFDEFELDENDVVFSSDDITAATLDPISNSPPPPHPLRHHHQPQHRFSPNNSGLSAALSDDNHHPLIRRKSTLNPSISATKAIPQLKSQIQSSSKFHQSAPVDVPVWPNKYKKNDSDYLDKFDEVDDELDGDDEMVPPHVIIARSHVTFSVFEGVGRTLKGRDLRRVRNAVFQKTGFID